ncbi:hypothetical protein ES332_D12G107300v1 [Gossypium tomentosum]|uniref:Uncharacterized protein n=1 Tax=Gossypium tomentosum TaxID=34277 RepID=A0A5D2I719_GOSTO|nr:hypothetical protein ES332_D12G107300v1 [Gossypium tomentosum]
MKLENEKKLKKAIKTEISKDSKEEEESLPLQLGRLSPVHLCQNRRSDGVIVFKSAQIFLEGRRLGLKP